MPSTAAEMVQAARICFGRPKDQRAKDLMTRWLDAGCRDWRRESSEDAEEVVVSAVFAMPIQAQKLRVQIAKNVDRWGFFRRGHVKEHLQFISIDSYMDGGVGNLVRGRVRDLLRGALQKFEKVEEDREKARKAKLAAFRAKQRQRHLPVLQSCLKSLWDVASNRVRKKLLDKGKGFREDPVARRRRMGRGVEYERLDEYTEEGEPQWDVIDSRKPQVRITVGY